MSFKKSVIKEKTKDCHLKNISECKNIFKKKNRIVNACPPQRLKCQFCFLCQTLEWKSFTFIFIFTLHELTSTGYPNTTHLIIHVQLS